MDLEINDLPDWEAGRVHHDLSVDGASHVLVSLGFWATRYLHTKRSPIRVIQWVHGKTTLHEFLGIPVLPFKISSTVSSV